MIYNSFKKFISKKLNVQLERACATNDLAKVKHLLTSKKFKNYIDINFSNDMPFIKACELGHFEIIKYLLTSSELKKNVNFHTQKDFGFVLLNSNCLFEQKILTQNTIEFMKYLIFELKIGKTEEISKCLSDYPNIEVERLFEQRELNENLKNNLNININRTKPIKL